MGQLLHFPIPQSPTWTVTYDSTLCARHFGETYRTQLHYCADEAEAIDFAWLNFLDGKPGEVRSE